MNPSTVRRIQEELRQIAALLEEITSQESHWNGELHLIQGADFLGKKPFDCRIELDVALADADVRWRTLLHESLHALSSGYNQRDYNAFYGWEEGVVERLQRLLRPTVLSHLGIMEVEAACVRAEAAHPFNPYIVALQQVRAVLGAEDELTFFLALLRTPIRDRHAFLLHSGLQIGGEQGKRIIAAVSSARVLLERRLR